MFIKGLAGINPASFNLKMARFLPILSVLLYALCLSGCGTVEEEFSDASPQVVAEPDPVSSLLADAADRASKSLETLAAIEYARAPGIAVGPVGSPPPELRRAMTINWVGPVEPITKTLAARAGYDFLVIGTPPPVPIVVSIDAENRQVIDILRDVGLQLGLRGNVKVDSTNHIVEIHYAPNTGIGK